MKQNISISLIHDTRRQKVNGAFPVKVRTIHKRTVILSSTGIDLLPEDFQKIIQGKRLSEALHQEKEKLEEYLVKARHIANSLIPFNKEVFVSKMNGSWDKAEFEKKGYTVSKAFELASNKINLKLASKISYQTSLKALDRYLKNNQLSPPEELPLSAIDVNFLRSFHKYLESESKSMATIGLYMRNIRAVFNEAIACQKIAPGLYPFGKRKYVPPVAKGIKVVLTREELKKLVTLDLDENSLECFSRDWFLICYLCNGMNVGDLLKLKNEDLRPTGFHFVREKTRTTSNGSIGQIRVDFGESWRELILQIISRQRSDNREPQNFLFPCYTEHMNESERMKRKMAFIKKINQHLPKVCKLACIEKRISTQTARHTFASNLYASDVNITDIQLFLGHNSPKTTENYLHSLKNEKTSRAIENLI